MPNSTLIYCCPVPGLERYWDMLGDNGQLFYDHRTNLFTFRKDQSFVAVSLKDNLPAPDTIFQLDINETILSLSYSRNKRFAAIQTATIPLRIFNIESGHELDIKFKHLEKTSTLVTFEWLWDQHCTIDLFALTTTGIFLFRVDEKKTKLKQLTHFPLEFQYSWFEPKSEVLLLANTSGLVQSVFFSSYPKTKKIKGPTFVLDLRSKTLTKNQLDDLNKSVTTDTYLKYNTQNLSIAPSLRNRNILQEIPADSNKQKAQHKILFVSMYGAPTLVHMNVEYGSIFLFSVTSKRVDICQSSLTVPPNGMYNLTLVDNLIVVHNTEEGKSYIFDIKKSNPSKFIGPAVGIPRRSSKILPSQHGLHDIMMTTSAVVTLFPLEMRRSRSAPNEEGVINGMNLNKKEFSDKKKEKEKMVRDEVIIFDVNTDKEEENKEQEEEEKKKEKHVKMDEYENDMGQSMAPSMMAQSMALGEAFPSDRLSYITETVPNIDPGLPEERDFCQPSESESQVRSEPKDECLYSSSARILDENYFIDLKNKILLTYEIDFKVASNLFHDNINAFFFLVRRTGCKELAINFLKKIIENKEEVMNLSFIFHKLLEIYRKVQERRTLKEMQNLATRKKKENVAESPKNFLMEESMLSSKISSADQQSTLSGLSPYNVIIQTDLYVHIFLPLTEDPDFDHEYLIHVLLEYLRASMENSVQVLDGIQAIFFKVVIMKKKFAMLYQLLQFHCLDDSLELAEVLIKLGMKDKSNFEGSPSNPLIRFINDDYLAEAFQLGLDMLGRLQKMKKVIKYLLMIGKITDALEIATRKGFEGIDPRWFLDAAAKHATPKILDDLTQFFLKSVKKGKGSDSNTIASNMVEIVQTFKSQHNSPQKG